MRGRRGGKRKKRKGEGRPRARSYISLHTPPLILLTIYIYHTYLRVKKYNLPGETGEKKKKGRRKGALARIGLLFSFFLTFFFGGTPL